MADHHLMVLSGAAGRRRDVAFLRRHGHGRMLNPDCWKNPRGVPYAVDNGAYAAWTNGTAFPEAKFLRLLAKVPRGEPPIFGVCPDIVAAGAASLAFSQTWRSRLSQMGYDWIPWYLPVQDGVSVTAVLTELRTGRWAGLFIGGSRAWKRQTAPQWVAMAHGNGLRVHIGCMPNLQDLVWARRLGADSVDSTSFARNDAHHRILAAAQQQMLVTREG